MIIQGDNGTHLRINVRENNVPLDLSGATVNVKIKTDSRVFTKQAQITGRGECEVELTSDDVATKGYYQVQVTITYIDNSKYSSDIQGFTVGESL